jgi:pyruvate/2-oxoglutarate dehydrogenase complex dihydrolipoamide acyltransferase (E2) component
MTTTSPATQTPADEVAIPDGYADVPHEFSKFKLRRRAAARAMVAASQVPTLTADVEVDMTAVLSTRASWNAKHEAPERLSVMSFLATAAVATLLEHPLLNASYTDAGLLEWRTINLGVAVDAPSGLVVPVIRDAQRLTVVGIAAQVRDLADKARGRGLSPQLLSGGTFTLSNPGAVGPVLRAEALLNPPQVALLGLPAMRRTPVVVTHDDEETVAIRPVLRPSLSFDHRALGGADAIRYLTGLKDKLESWDLESYLAERGGS